MNNITRKEDTEGNVRSSDCRLEDTNSSFGRLRKKKQEENKGC